MNQRDPARTMDEVRPAAEQFDELIWPESILPDTKEALLGFAADLDPAGGIASTRAKNELIAQGYGGLFAIVERLRQLDYRRADDAALGFELNQALAQMTGGLNARFQAVDADEQIHPAKAQWNTKTVRAWLLVLQRWPDEAAFLEFRRRRQRR